MKTLHLATLECSAFKTTIAKHREKCTSELHITAAGRNQADTPEEQGHKYLNDDDCTFPSYVQRTFSAVFANLCSPTAFIKSASQKQMPPFIFWTSCSVFAFLSYFLPSSTSIFTAPLVFSPAVEFALILLTFTFKRHSLWEACLTFWICSGPPNSKSNFDVATSTRHVRRKNDCGLELLCL